MRAIKEELLQHLDILLPGFHLPVACFVLFRHDMKKKKDLRRLSECQQNWQLSF